MRAANGCAPEEGAWGEGRDCCEAMERWDVRREVARCRRPTGEPRDEPRAVCRGDTALDVDRAVSRILQRCFKLSAPAVPCPHMTCQPCRI